MKPSLRACGRSWPWSPVAPRSRSLSRISGSAGVGQCGLSIHRPGRHQRGPGRKYGPQLLVWPFARHRDLRDVNTDQQNLGLQALLNYDRPTAARLGLTPQLIDNTLYDAFGQAEVSTIFTAPNQYYVVMEVAPKYWQSPHGLDETYLIQTTGGAPVPLKSISQYTVAHIAAGGQSHRAISFRHSLLQSGTGCFSQPGHTEDRIHRAESAYARRDPRRVFRHAAGV